MAIEENVYKPPESEIVQETQAPSSFYTGTFNAKKLKFLAWLTLASLLVDIPGFVLSFMYGFEGGAVDYEIYMHLFTVMATVIWIYILVNFKKFVIERFEFNKINWHVSALIVLSLILGLLSILLVDAMKDPASQASIAFYLVMIPYGVVSILLGRKLLSIEYDYKFLRLLAWLFILAGVCTASLLLVIFASLLGLAYTVVIAMIFFAGEKEMRERTSG